MDPADLDLVLESRRGIPIYRQIVDGIRYAVSSGRLLPRERLPSVRALSAHLEVNVATVQRAYRELEVTGVVLVRRGRGTYVADDPASIGEKERIETLWREIQGVLTAARELDISREELRDLFHQGLADAYEEDEDLPE
jgi:GntR family transcriptional regulator